MSHAREKKKKGEYKEGGQKKTKENLNLREFKLEKIIISWDLTSNYWLNTGIGMGFRTETLRFKCWRKFCTYALNVL